MKNIIFTLILTILLSVTPAIAADNNLNAVILEGTDKGYNITLRADKVASLKKSVQSDGTLVLNLKNTTTSESLDTRYVNTTNIDNLIVEAIGNNDVKIHIKAKDIGKANIIFDTPASSPVVVGDKLSRKTIGWSVFTFLLICFILGSLKQAEEEETLLADKKDMTEREIKMYKAYKMEILNSAKIDYKLNKQYLKRNSAHADTIRNLQKASYR